MKLHTVQRTGVELQWIDQTCLPAELVRKQSGNYQDIIDAIKKLEVRGAPAIGIAAGYGIAVAVVHTGKWQLEDIEDVGKEFKNARPTAVNLFWAVDRVVGRIKTESPDSQDETVKILWGEAEDIHREDIELCRKIGENGAGLIKDKDTVLTHCNAGALATGGIGTALGVIYTCAGQGKRLTVYADETRPLLQGARLTTWELMYNNIDVTLICDNTAGMLMKQGKIKHVIVGADRIARNGDFANKIGTYAVAVLAREHNIPFYVAAPYSTFDDNIESGDEIIIEERAPEEVTEGFGKRTAPEGVKVYSPAFDVTPAELVTYYITDKGLTRGKRG